MADTTREHDLKYENRFHGLLRLVRQNPGIAGSELVVKTQTFKGWQRRELLDDLIAKGLIREEVKKPGGRGRPKRLYFAIETQQDADSGQEGPLEEMAFFDASRHKDARAWVPVPVFMMLTGRRPKPSEIEPMPPITEEDGDEFVKEAKIERERKRALNSPY